ncbi:RloB family protein [Pseudoalteromonas rubra]|uniref:CRISPR-associated protein n=1 Tax=Pseudoalteromonas rubra TaxID=43658 RepID=A0A5S3X0S9_9GAMM|nr:RloB family protein [Pseudoalteromonas rubra]TMP37526.1 CRISPR-associated protein [Pseudoalteromonas rubra]
MGSDDLFKKRKRAAKTKHSRREGRRSAYETVLIVTEGEKTEPYYFQELIADYRLNSANIVVDGSSNSSPSSILKHAKCLAKRAKEKGIPYDRVYCVFDKDSHACYEKTVEQIGSIREFYCVRSVPCFEYWFLLHYDYSTASIVGTGTQSCGDNAVKALKQYIPEYEKADISVYHLIKPHMQFAINNAKRSLAESERNFNDNPSTSVHLLVEFLINLKG